MRSFFRDSKGAVTVFVTLLLIPAMLVSGTAVDLARLHAARSIVSDANQLAANSVLTQYNALLQDLYGLMGVAEDDPVLFDLLDDYIRVSIFGESHDNRMGTLQVFYGSNLSVEEIEFEQSKNLRESDVLRRQIEEYMKFRGPVIIVRSILDAFDNNTLDEDTEIVGKKLEIDSVITEMYTKYLELYKAISLADKCTLPIGGISGGSFGSLSSRLVFIRDEFINLRNAYSAWSAATDTSIKADHAAHYNAIRSNIRSYTIGGQRGSSWSGGSWGSTTNINVTIETMIANAKASGDNFKPNFDEVVRLARELDAMNRDLRQRIDEFEEMVNSDGGNQELKQSFTERTGDPPMSLIERYRAILEWDDITGMATPFRDGGHNYIDNSYKPMLDGVRYRNSANAAAGSLSISELANLPTDPRFNLSESGSAESSMAGVFAGFPRDSVTYSMPPGFMKFADYSGRNREFFDFLKSMVEQPPVDPVGMYDGQEESSGENGETKQRGMIRELLDLVELAYTGLRNDPLGASYISDNDTPARETMGIAEIVRLIPQALSEPVINIIKDPRGSVERTGDYLLMLTYSTSMFSNYTTTRPQSVGKTMDDLHEIDFPDSITRVPISPEVNYFFQSEWEYLYSGHDNAARNLNSVTRLLFLVRLVCNYIAVFSVREVTTIVTSIKAAFAWNPPLALILGELARAAFVAAETLIDLAALRTGHKVPIIKSASRNEWVCSPSGVRNAISRITSDSSGDGGGGGSDRGITYSHYMLLFFMTRAIFYVGANGDAATELAIRTGNLIEWNMINYIAGANADEEKMTEALANSNRFRLSDMQTSFSITTSVDMTMLFLSRPFARNFSDARGIGMPRTIPIRETDYRGY